MAVPGFALLLVLLQQVPVVPAIGSLADPVQQAASALDQPELELQDSPEEISTY